MTDGEMRQPLTPRAERMFSRLLFGGALLSVIVFAIGIVLALASSSITDVSQPMSLGSIADSIASMNVMGLIGCGMLILVATPLIRIFATILYFSLRDRWLMVLPVVTVVLIMFGFAVRM